jgi:hypothetical protein
VDFGHFGQRALNNRALFHLCSRLFLYQTSTGQHITHHIGSASEHYWCCRRDGGRGGVKGKLRRLLHLIVDVWSASADQSGTFSHFSFVFTSTNNQQVNTSLKDLNLYGNKIGPAGVTAVAEALKVS